MRLGLPEVDDYRVWAASQVGGALVRGELQVEEIALGGEREVSVEDCLEHIEGERLAVLSGFSLPGDLAEPPHRIDVPGAEMQAGGMADGEPEQAVIPRIPSDHERFLNRGSTFVVAAGTEQAAEREERAYDHERIVALPRGEHRFPRDRQPLLRFGTHGEVRCEEREHPRAPLGRVGAQPCECLLAERDEGGICEAGGHSALLLGHHRRNCIGERQRVAKPSSKAGGVARIWPVRDSSPPEPWPHRVE